MIVYTSLSFSKQVHNNENTKNENVATASTDRLKEQTVNST